MQQGSMHSSKLGHAPSPPVRASPSLSTTTTTKERRTTPTTLKTRNDRCRIRSTTTPPPSCSPQISPTFNDLSRHFSPPCFSPTTRHERILTSPQTKRLTLASSTLPSPTPSSTSFPRVTFSALPSPSPSRTRPSTTLLTNPPAYSSTSAGMINTKTKTKSRANSLGTGFAYNPTPTLPFRRPTISHPRSLSSASSISSSGLVGAGVGAGDELRLRAKEALRASKFTRAEIEERRNSRTLSIEFEAGAAGGVGGEWRTDLHQQRAQTWGRGRTSSEWSKGPSPRKLLKKTRSIPLNLHSTPSSSTSPSPRRVASYQFLNYSPPHHPDFLPLPIDNQPTSKFSNSTGGSGDSASLSRRKRTMSRATSLRNLLSGGTSTSTSTPNEKSLRKKGSLAKLLGGGGTGGSPETIDSTSTKGRGGLRGAFKELTNSKASGFSGAKGEGSQFGGSEHSSETSGGSKKSWVASKLGRIGQQYRKKERDREVSPAVVQFAERVSLAKGDENITKQIPRPKLPSRIPISAVFPTIIPTPTLPANDRPFSNLADVKKFSELEHLPPIRPRTMSATVAPLKSSIPVKSTQRAFKVFNDQKKRPAKPTIAPIDTTIRTSRLPRRRSSTIRAPAPSLLPPAQLRGPNPSMQHTTDSDDTGPLHSTPPYQRSPSPARFRDLLPSPPAASSPQKNGMDLPLPEDSPKSLHSKKTKDGSPKRLAMGPEQVIGMGEGGSFRNSSALDVDGLQMVAGVTSDLAELLSALREDTTGEITRSDFGQGHTTNMTAIEPLHNDLSKSLRQHLPKIESIESLRSTVSDVPDDLRRLIQSVSDQISEVELNFEEDEDEDVEGNLIETYQHQDDLTTSSVSSFEGHASTAAAALRSMLHGEEQAEQQDAREKTSRDSVQEYLSMERPTIGDKMMDRMDIEVSLTSLVSQHSPPPSPSDSRMSTQPTARPALAHRRTVSRGSTSGSSIVSFGSPTPANGLRRTMVRYSADPERNRRFARPSVRSGHSSIESEWDRHPSPPSEDHTSCSLAQSTRSTNLSISSVNSSPCPNPRQRRIPMLTRHVPPVPPPTFRFPQPNANATVTGGSNQFLPWTASKSSTESKVPASKGDSPFKKTFNPLEQFRAKKKNGSSPEKNLSGNVEEAKQEPTGSSPRFVRPLQPPRTGEAVPRPRPLSLTNALIPPDTPPPSSPSASDRSDRSSHSSISSVRRSLEVDRQSFPPPAATRHSRGHSRQISRASNILQDVILEERESPLSSPAGPVLVADLAVSTVDLHLLETIDEPTLVEELNSSFELEDASPPQLARPPTQTFHVEFGTSTSPGTAILPEDISDEEEELVEYEEQEPGFLAVPVEDKEHEDDINRKWLHFNYEAETELKRSAALWPDAERTREIIANFIPPTNIYDILSFLFDSQDRFRSRYLPSSLSTFNLLQKTGTFEDDEAEQLEPLQDPPEASDVDSFEDDDNVLPANISVSPPSPEPLPFISGARLPFGSKPVNQQLTFTKSTSSPRKEDTLSPFTALPPRLGLKLRNLRAKISPKKRVDVAFLGQQATRRRKEQFDAARRRLEGVGTPDEQRSDEESSEDVSDRSGEFEGSGESDVTREFPKPTRLSISKPRALRRKVAISTLR